MKVFAHVLEITHWRAACHPQFSRHRIKENQNAFQRSCPWSTENRKVVGFSSGARKIKHDANAVCYHRGLMHLSISSLQESSPVTMARPPLRSNLPASSHWLATLPGPCALTAAITLVERVKKETASQNVLSYTEFLFFFFFDWGPSLLEGKTLHDFLLFPSLNFWFYFCSGHQWHPTPRGLKYIYFKTWYLLLAFFLISWLFESLFQDMVTTQTSMVVIYKYV